MKKKILFVIPSLELGGAEKSLVNLLNEIDETKYDIDLFLFYKKGFFIDAVPPHVNILCNDTKKFKSFSQPLGKFIGSFFKKIDVLGLYHRLCFTIKNRIISNPAIAEQNSWINVKHFYPKLQNEYDVAIGYLEKSTHYFVVDNIKAKKKIGWIHTDLQALKLNLHHEEKYFNKLDKVVFVSEGLQQRLAKVSPFLKDKSTSIENIVSSKIINDLSMKTPIIQFDNQKFNIIFIGRLVEEKGLYLAIDALGILSKKGYDFRFYLVGKGILENNLRSYAERNNIIDKIIFLGAQSNPYSLIKQSSLFLMTSLYEGKSIALEEAKILKVPIVITNFSSANDQITDKETGLIAEMNPLSIANCIEVLMKDPIKVAKFKSNLEQMVLGNESEIEKFYKLVDEKE